MKQRFSKAILRLSIAWGVIFLVIGVFASFSIGANDTKTSLAGFALVFLLPIIASVAARWMPMVSGYALLVAVIAVLIGFYASGSLMDVLRVLGRVYLWFHILFGVTFIIMAKQINSVDSGKYD